MTKIKRTEKPAKTFEEKTSEEKIKTMQQLSKEIEATGAKSIMKTSKGGKKAGNVSFGQCLVYEYDKDPVSNEIAKRVDSKDISDMRDEKTKMRDLLQEQENKQLAEFKRVQDMMNQKTGQSKSDSPDKFKSSASAADKVEDSIAESASLSQSHEKRRDRPTESYDTDTFEEASASKEKGGINYWPGKAAMDASESMSTSKPAGDAEIFSTDAMEEYMRKQAAKKGGGLSSAPPAPAKTETAKKDFSESSDKYTDEDFESMSKSQSQLTSAGLPKVGGPKPAALSTFSGQTRIA